MRGDRLARTGSSSTYVRLSRIQKAEFSQFKINFERDIHIYKISKTSVGSGLAVLAIKSPKIVLSGNLRLKTFFIAL